MDWFWLKNEISCVIGNNEMDDEFDFSFQERIIGGDLNSKYIDNLIVFLKKHYSLIMRNHKGFHYMY